MELTVQGIAASVGWALLAAAAVWLVTWPVRRRSMRGLVVATVLTGTAASAGALLGAVHEMLLPMHNWPAVVILTITAGIIAAGAAIAASRRLAADRRSLARAVAELGSGAVDTGGNLYTGELAQLREQLSATARELHEARDRERALDASRRELVAWVSHDLRTPLAGLRAMSEALEDGVSDDPERYYKQIRMSVDRLSVMVDDLFDLSRIQAGSVARESDEFDLSDLVSDCIASLAALAEARRVDLSGTAETQLTVSGTGTELNRALVNVIANALRHTPPEGAVTVHATREGDSAVVAVADQCGGIAGDSMERLFDVGFRAENARPADPDDPMRAGLGLAITRGIIEAHNGTVEVANLGPGCEFRITLPLSQES